MEDKQCNEYPTIEPNIPKQNINDIKPYVAVGFNDTFSVTVHKSTFDTAFIIFIIIFAVIIIAFIIVTIILVYNITKTPSPPPGLPLNIQPLTINSNYGASPYAAYPSNKKIKAPNDGSGLITKDDCLNSQNTKWVNDHCECITPFFGEFCSREKHDNKFFAVGIPHEETLMVSIIDDIISNGKSFNIKEIINSQSSDKDHIIYDNIGSCSDYCNNTPGCNSFIYHNPNICTLLSGDIIVPRGEGIAYSTNIDPTLYMKSSDNLHFEDRIFLGEFTWSFPSRYWLTKETNGYIQLSPGIVSKLKFYPEYIKIYGNYTGIYCKQLFNIEDVDDIIQYLNPDQCYIHYPNTRLKVPIDWKYELPIYVVYV